MSKLNENLQENFNEADVLGYEIVRLSKVNEDVGSKMLVKSLFYCQDKYDSKDIGDNFKEH